MVPSLDTPDATLSLKGQLLLDQGKLQGTYFHRTVILVCQHDAEGAFGLVLNRTIGRNLGEVLAGDLTDRLRELPLFNGGPVQEEVVSYLHSDAFLPEANVLPNLALGHSLDHLLELGDSYSPAQKIKVFSGYAGWSAGQLDDEMRRDTWMTHPASLDLIYSAHPDRLWSSILRQKGGIYRLLADAPEDLSWN